MSTGKKEVRFTAKAEVRARANAKGKVIGGYAAMFNSVTDIGPFREVIRRGAFKRTLAAGADVRCLFNHNQDKVLGRTASGTLRVWEDQDGLQYECDLPETSAANDLYESIQRGDIDQCSFGFSCDESGDNWLPPQGAETKQLRELLNVDLFDVSAVTYPAYEATSVGTRSMFPEGMEHVEARMASLRAEARDIEKSVRAARVKVLLAEHETWKQQRTADELAATDEQLKTRLEFLKAA
jgi:HK97 family phage prohead protease